MSSFSEANGCEAAHSFVQMAVQDALLEAEQHLNRLLEETASVREQVHNLRRLQKGLASIRSFESGIRGQPIEAINTSKRETEKVTKPASSEDLGFSDKRGNRELRRACRIALMEAVEPQTVSQIVERIVRRESFSFGKELNPEKAVAVELVFLVHEGEADGSTTAGTFQLAPMRG